MITASTPFTLGEPQTVGPLAVHPVLGPEPRLAYRAYADALALGAFVKELDAGASVGELLVQNPTDQALLLYEGEEVIGAQQNRTLDVSVLVAAGTRLEIPVSCVEQGRWDGRRAAEHFTPAPQAADPSLRRLKRRAANAAAAAGMVARADQGEVWHEVGARLHAHAVHSPSAAMSDVFDARRDEIDALGGAIHQLPGQLGAVASVEGRVVALDMVSRPDVFASLLPRLAQGYALDALGGAGRASGSDSPQAFLDAALAAGRRAFASPGLGDAFAIATPGVIGSGLALEKELIQLSAFPGTGDAAPIRRPSMRRPRAV